MRSIVRTGLVSVAATGMLAAGGMATPANAAVNVGNLVNVNISNVANNNDVAVTVPINAAANICGVSVAALVADLSGDQTANCDARGNQTVSVTD